MDKYEVIEKLRGELPPIMARNSLGHLFGGLVNPRTLSNLDSVGQGPPRIRVGRKIAYPRDSFLDWLAARMIVVEDKNVRESDDRGDNWL